MNDHYQHLGSRLAELVTPSRTDVRRAKKVVLQALHDGRPHRTAALVRAAAIALGGPEVVDRLEIRFVETPTPERLTGDEPVLLNIKGRLAGQEAIAELAARGLAVPAPDPGDEYAEPRERVLEDRVDVRIDHPRGGFGLKLDVWPPLVGPAYRLAQNHLEPPWYLDPDLFLGDLDVLGFDERAQRALREALDAYRAGLYLACASLLGVVSESVWYDAATRLGAPPKLMAAVQQERTAEVQRLLTQEFRAAKVRPPTLPDELHSQAALLREIRNYGLHRGPEKDELERFFNEDACGLLILSTHNYLVRLGRAIGALVASTP